MPSVMMLDDESAWTICLGVLDAISMFYASVLRSLSTVSL